MERIWLKQWWLKQYGKNPQNTYPFHYFYNRLLRERKVPLQYIIGSQPFNSVMIKCRPPILIPRPETEQLSAFLSHLISHRFRQVYQNTPFKILDVGCGSGCISISIFNNYLRNYYNLKRSGSERRVLLQVQGIDCDKRAVLLSRLNARINLPRKYHRYYVSNDKYHDKPNISFMKVDLMSKDAEECFKDADVIISNPPYLSSSEYEDDSNSGLEYKVKKWESKKALVGDSNRNTDGLLYYRRLVELLKQAQQDLATQSNPDITYFDIPIFLPGYEEEQLIKQFIAKYDTKTLPMLACEYGGNHQTQALIEIFSKSKLFKRIMIGRDFAGKERFIFGFS